MLTKPKSANVQNYDKLSHEEQIKILNARKTQYLNLANFFNNKLKPKADPKVYYRVFKGFIVQKKFIVGFLFYIFTPKTLIIYFYRPDKRLMRPLRTS